MPIYEYSCTICDNRFDRLRSMSQMDAEAPCPDCGSVMIAKEGCWTCSDPGCGYSGC